MKADLHIHSNFSYGAISKPESILEMAADRHINMIAVTDHNAAASWREFDKVAHNYPVQVIKGQEIKLFNDRFATGDVLALFLQRPIQSTNLADILAEVKSQNGILTIARPFCGRRGEFRAFDQIDDWSNIAIETKNGRTHKDRDNDMARGLAEMLNLPVTAGSDAHTPFEVGNVYVEFDGHTPQELHKALLNRDVAVCGVSSHLLFSLISYFARLGLAI